MDHNNDTDKLNRHLSNDDDSSIKALFDAFNPATATDDDTFLDRLSHSMRAVEMVQQQSSATRRLHKRALAIAAAVGMIVGFALSLAMPWVSSVIASTNITLTSFISVADTQIIMKIAAWGIIATIAAILAYNAYEIIAIKSRPRSTSLSTLTPRKD
ncbi:MAG: hypothetical protein ACI30W_03995 [Muribaculaceae bacterium]